MVDTIASAKHAFLTQMEKDIGKLEEKEELIPSDGKKITCLKKLAKEHDRDFEERHVEVLNFTWQKIQLLWNHYKPSLMNMWIVSQNSSNH